MAWLFSSEHMTLDSASWGNRLHIAFCFFRDSKDEEVVKSKKMPNRRQFRACVQLKHHYNWLCHVKK